MRLSLFCFVLICSASQEAVSEIVDRTLNQWTDLFKQKLITESELAERHNQVSKFLDFLHFENNGNLAKELNELIQKYSVKDKRQLSEEKSIVISNIKLLTERLRQEKRNWLTLIGKKKRIKAINQQLETATNHLSLLDQNEIQLQKQITSVPSSNVKLAGRETKHFEGSNAVILKKIAHLQVELVESEAKLQTFNGQIEKEEKKFFLFRNHWKIHSLNKLIREQQVRISKLKRDGKTLLESIKTESVDQEKSAGSNFDPRQFWETDIKRLEENLKRVKGRNAGKSEAAIMDEIRSSDSALAELPIKQKSKSELKRKTNQLYEEVEKMKAKLSNLVFSFRSARQQKLLEFHFERAQRKLSSLEKELEESDKIEFLRYKRLNAMEALEKEQKKWRFSRNKDEVIRLEKEIDRLTEEIDLLNPAKNVEPTLHAANETTATILKPIVIETNDLGELKEKWRVSFKKYSEAEENIRTKGKVESQEMVSSWEHTLTQEKRTMEAIELRMTLVDPSISLSRFLVQTIKVNQLQKKDAEKLLSLVEMDFERVDTVVQTFGVVEAVNILLLKTIPLLDKALELNENELIQMLPFIKQSANEKAISDTGVVLRERMHKKVNELRQRMSSEELNKWQEILKKFLEINVANGKGTNSYLEYVTEEYKQVGRAKADLKLV